MMKNLQTKNIANDSIEKLLWYSYTPFVVLTATSIVSFSVDVYKPLYIIPNFPAMEKNKIKYWCMYGIL